MFEGMFGLRGELFHIGIRVPDLDAAMLELGASHGVEWTSVRDSPFRVWEPGAGYAEYPLRLCFSREGPCRPNAGIAPNPARTWTLITPPGMGLSKSLGASPPSPKG